MEQRGSAPAHCPSERPETWGSGSGESRGAAGAAAWILEREEETKGGKTQRTVTERRCDIMSWF